MCWNVMRCADARSMRAKKKKTKTKTKKRANEDSGYSDINIRVLISI